MRQAGEPSVEEILESIKKVIARDNRAEAAQARARRDAPAAAEAPAVSVSSRVHEVLDLTEIAAHILSDDSVGADGAEAPTADSPLLPETTAASMRDSLAALAMLSEPGVPPQIVRSGETSLEGLVREMLRPMLAEWLDKNLPPMVEKMVATEIARIVGKKS
ncbi:DUF2497 domain-containing protein [Novosphingobium sp. KCTC 2891]|uniref:DUF2497 domain-containing protein n=1 Tax=Novosphingobium sp. KCTC 2891 TaxID=2989730 RepID=UPI0022234AF3|nr:DUF2497 domain-containing protein [Novosphingobium sp. KCTC 2891]MCW1382206.1 DUF2497 domain-containing protein [Novosphingobium sp. KCTC 2891]